MSNMDNISDQLFAKIRGRFPAVTIGNEAGEVTDDPKTGRYFDFDYIVGEDILGRVSITLTEKEIAVVYNTNFIAEQPDGIKSDWYNFLKEIRNFAKRNMLNFDTRDINKSNLDKRDYAHLTKTAGEKQMSETKMYGTSRTSYEDIDKARLVLKHRQPVNQEVPGARTQHVEAIYIESENGERYKYPMRHLNGARALAQHVSNGGNLYDDFGKHIVSLSEELGKLKQFKTYINRSAVMAEGLKGYMDMVNERIDSIKTEVMKLQRPNYYAETIKDFAPVVMEEVPEDLQNSWIDELTIRTFNEELKSVFPYINRLVKEKNKIKEVGPDEASGPEGSMEPHAHKFYIDGDYDQDRGISDKDCEQMEMACKKAGIECKCEPDEMRQGGVVIHTMAPRDAVIDALDKEGYNVEEAIFEPADDFADRINSINPKHDESEQDASEGNEFAQKVRELKAKGAKPGTKFKTSDGEEHTLEQAITKVGLNVEDFFTAEELANEKPMTQADLDAERFSDMHDFENFKDAVMSEIEDGKNGKGQYAGKDKKEIIAMLRKEADSIGYADVSDGERHPSEPTWLKAVADELEKSKTADQTEEEDPKTDFTKWLMKNYNKSPRDLKGDEYVKMSKMFQASKKKEDAETEEPEIELEEFIKSLYDYTSNTFPKGETAVLTAVEKKYGESSMRPAAEMMKELVSGQDQEMERIKKLAGV